MYFLNCSGDYSLNDGFKYTLNKITIVIILFTNVSVNVSCDYLCTKPQLEILITAKSKFLSLYWSIEEIKPNDWVGLYKQIDSTENPSVDEKLASEIIKTDNGYLDTKKVYKFNVPDDKKYVVEERKLGYYAIYWRLSEGTNKVLVKTWLKTFPNWMEHYWELIKDRPINEVFIPGTHDSSSFLGINHDSHMKTNTNLNKLNRILSFTKNLAQEKFPPVNLYAITQSVPIFEQLLNGIRYLDIRVLKDGDTYWTHHAGFYMVKLTNVISDVLRFVLQTKREVVIFDIHELKSAGSGNLSTKDFSPGDHISFVTWLKERFTYKSKSRWIEYSSEKNWDKTVSEISAGGENIIITYPDKKTSRKEHLHLMAKCCSYMGE